MSNTMSNKYKGPKVGDVVIVRGVRCRVFKIRDFGTFDVEEIDGPHAWRISGGPFFVEVER